LTLEAKNIFVRINGKEILRDVSLTAGAGERMAIIGPNGAGKSTLLRALAALQPICKGEILLDGENICRINRNKLAKRMAVLPQQNIAPSDLTVERLVEYGRFPYRNWRHSDYAADRRAVDEALKQTKLTSLRDREVNTLSGGERQRACLAMALAQLNRSDYTLSAEPQFLFLDEPTTYLDIAHQSEVMETVTAAQKSQGLAVIMVLHDLNHALKYADKVVIVKNGRIVEQGKSKEIMRPDILKKIFEVKIDYFCNQAGNIIIAPN